MVEAIVTVANEQTLLKATANPLTNRDRAFVSCQFFTVPNRFWGMGVMEKGYWPQKVLDSEIRARTDSLAFHAHPMMAVDASGLPRSENFTLRPGRTINTNGNPRDTLEIIQFPAPDPQTYTQSAEMQRMVEMATGQMQAATPMQVNGRNNTASGMSMIMGASIRRTRKTLANMEKNYFRPLIRKAVWRFQQFDDRYPLNPVDFKVNGTLGMMAREFEQAQLTQMLNALPPGPQSLIIMREVVDNGSSVNKQAMLQLIDGLLQQALNPPEPPPDLSAEARMLSAQARVQEVQQQGQIELQKLENQQLELQLKSRDAELNHQRGVMAISVEADAADATAAKDETAAILNLANAQAEEQANSIAQLKAEMEAIKALPATTIVQGNDEETGVIAELRAELDAIRAEINQPETLDISPIRVERDAEGLITGVGDRRVLRDQNGLIEEIV